MTTGGSQAGHSACEAMFRMLRELDSEVSLDDYYHEKQDYWDIAGLETDIALAQAQMKRAMVLAKNRCARMEANARTLSDAASKTAAAPAEKVVSMSPAEVVVSMSPAVVT